MTNKAATQKDRHSVFVLMPFREEFDDVYDVVKSTCREFELDCLRADEIDRPGQITDQIIESIKQADAIIADLTGSNPNVMYELGVAHSLDKPAIMINQSVERSPFDVAGMRQIVYDRNRLITDLRPRLVTSLADVINRGFQQYTDAWASASQHSKVDRNRVFISYCHADLDILDRVLVHLKPLEKQGVIDTWVDTRIKAGEKWQDRIKTALASAKVAILLISADFLASDFIVDNELPPLLAAAEQEGTRIIPVIVKPSRFLRDNNLAVFQALNDPTQPVIKMDEVEREELFVRLAQTVEYLS